MSPPVSVLFVCLGNICRSPIAEACFRKLTKFGTPDQHPGIKEIDSCGTGAYHAGDYSDPRSIQILAKNGIDDYRHASRKIRVPEDFERFEYILAMDEYNLRDLQDMAERAVSKGRLSRDVLQRIYLYGEFGDGAKNEEIGDPYYDRGTDGFQRAFDQATRFGKGLLEQIEKEAES